MPGMRGGRGFSGRGQRKGRKGGSHNRKGKGGRQGGGRYAKSTLPLLKPSGAMNVVSEQDVGICLVLDGQNQVVEALSEEQCFTGVIKHRFTDFQVHEVSPDGQTSRLTSLPMPKPVEGDNDSAAARKRARRQAQRNGELPNYLGIANLSKEYMERTSDPWRNYLCGNIENESSSTSRGPQFKSSEIFPSTSSANTKSSSSNPFKRAPLPDQRELVQAKNDADRASYVHSTVFTRFLVGTVGTPEDEARRQRSRVPVTKLTEDHEAVLKELDDIFGKDLDPAPVSVRLRSLMLTGFDSHGDKDSLFCLPATEDKLKRKTAHMALKRLPKCIVGDTISDPTGKTDGKAVRVRVTAKVARPKDGIRGNKRKRDHGKKFDCRGNKEQWPEDRPNYLRFLLYKENTDTVGAISKLARVLGCNTKVFSYAGTKDKRAVTVQAVTAYRVSEKNILRINRDCSRDGLSICSPTYVEKPLRLGQLNGNEFQIVLRDAKPYKEADSNNSDNAIISPNLPEIVRSATSLLRAQGFINYFGLQRFGTGSVPTHIVGKSLLKKEWVSVVEMILRSRLGDNVPPFPVSFKALKDLVQRVPRWMALERALLEGLMSQSKGDTQNYANALDAIPSTMRKLYLHAYQSYIWNCMVSERLRKLGCAPVEGDLVIDIANSVGNKQSSANGASALAKSPDALLEEKAALELETAAAVEIGAIGKKGGRSADIESASGSSTTSSASSSNSVSVKRLTASDIDSGKFSMYDVVMPLPGATCEYPSHTVGRETYERKMGSDGIMPEALQSRLSDKHDTETGNTIKRYVLEGGYRKVLRRVEDIETAIVWYDGEDQDLQPTDRDVLHYGGLTNPVGTENNGGSESGRKLQGVIAKFTLSPSSYATMCLRQLFGGRMSTKAGSPSPST